MSRAFPARRSRACSGSGTARVPASTGRATRCATPISPGRRRRAARWRSPATTTAPGRRPRSISPTPRFIAVGMPVLYPSNTQELIDFGLHGIAMSRFSGCWVGMKIVTDVAEGGGTVYVGPDAPAIVTPDRPAAPPGGFGAARRRCAADAGGAALRPQAPCGARLRARQRPQPDRLRSERRAGRSGRGRKGLAGPPAGARRPRTRAARPRRDGRRARPQASQGRHGVAARPGRDPGVRRRPRPRRGDRGEASARSRTRSGPSSTGRRARRGSWASISTGRRSTRRTARRGIPNFGETSPELVAEILVKALRRHDPDCGLGVRRGAGEEAQQPAGAGPQPGLLRRLSAQPIDPRARGKPGARRHRLPHRWRWS